MDHKSTLQKTPTKDKKKHHPQARKRTHNFLKDLFTMTIAMRAWHTTGRVDLRQVSK